MLTNRYDKGSYNTICDVCGWKYKARDLQKRWDGFYVCSKCFETRHPQDFIRGVADLQAPPWTRPEQADVFLPSCTPESMCAIPSLAGPGCCIPSKPLPVWYAPVPSSSFGLPVSADSAIPMALIPGRGIPGIQ